MNRLLWLGLLVVLPGLVGCTPPGSPEFYRSALQARSEFVDSLARVVDEKTAKEKYKISEKALNVRLLEIKEGLDRVKFDGTFRKLSSETFDAKKIDPADRALMIEGLKSYSAYCKNVVFTNVRLKREIQRLHRVANVELLAKAKAQLEAKQPVSVSLANDLPNLAEMFDSLSKLNAVNLRYVQPGLVTKENLAKIDSGLSDADLKEILEFDAQNLDVKVPGIDPPPPPPYPAWALDIDNRAKLGLTKDAAEKR